MVTSEKSEERFFSDLLREFRIREKLKQSQLAKQIGASREAVSLWERGMYKPETTTMVEVLVKALNLDDEEKRLFFEAYTGTASLLPLHNIPPHNPYFTGREEILSNLHSRLTKNISVALIQTQAVSGLGGIGKTQVAIEYAYRFREHYHNILWVAADSRETLINSYLTLAGPLRLREREQHKVVEAVHRWLREHKGWLLILDNIENLELVREFVPEPRQGAVVLTTRREETRPIAEALVLEVLTENEGSLFLLRRAGYLSSEAALETAPASYREAARALVQATGGLPLALDQAGAYVAETKRSLSDYLDLFEQRKTALLNRRGTLSLDHPLSVTATFSLAFEQVQQKNKAAIDLLKFWAFLAPDAIPLEIITEGVAHMGIVLQLVVIDEVQLDQSLETLQAYSLVQRNGENRTISIHRLVQAIQIDTMKSDEQCQWAERVVRAVNVAFPRDPSEKVATWPLCLRYLEQALVCDTLIHRYMLNFVEASDVLDRTGAYLFEHASYTMAEQLYQHALAIREQQLEPDDLRVGTSLNNLAKLYKEQGKYAEAESLYQRALAIREQQLNPDHPLVAVSLNGLANLYKEQGKYAEAEPMYQRALTIREQYLEPDDPQVATSLNNLANLYQVRGKYAEAEPMYQRALSIWERQLELEDPEMAHPLNNLASLYFNQGRYTEAEPLYQHALAIWEKQRHPQVAYVLNNLGELYEAQDMYLKAEPLYRRALAIWEQQEPLMVAFPLHNLASLLSKQSRYVEAEPLYRHALAIWEQQKHLLVAHPLDGLATLCFNQGRYAEAESLYLHALAIREQTLEPHHPDTAETLYGFAVLREAQGNHKGAISLYQRALSIHEHIFGSSHPKTTRTSEHLQAILITLGRAEEVAQLDGMQLEPVEMEGERTTGREASQCRQNPQASADESLK